MSSLSNSLSEEQAFHLGIEAYIYGYPLVLMNVTKDVSTAVPAPSLTRAPVNQFAHVPTFLTTPTAGLYPNADVLYSIAWLDLSLGPIVLSVADTGGRYSLMSLFDAWTNVFASMGTRTTGTKKAHFAIVAADWEGKIPQGLTLIQAPTPMVWIVGQTQTQGAVEDDTVQEIQAQYQLTPLRLWGKPYTPPPNIPVNPVVNLETPPIDQVKMMDVANFFGWLCHLISNNPPAIADAEMLGKLATIGIVPGQDFEIRSLTQPVMRGLEQAIQAGHEQVVMAGIAANVPGHNHWQLFSDPSSDGINYLHRAGTAWRELGAPLPQDITCWMTRVDIEGRSLNGKHCYGLHFEPDQLPPVNAFWSITLYDLCQSFVANPLNRYAIGDRDALILNLDGSLDLYIQATPPVEHESNWLPSPQTHFYLILRLYYPQLSVLQGIWLPPPIIQKSSMSV